jgi:hypothetical protein
MMKKAEKKKVGEREEWEQKKRRREMSEND